MVLFAALTFGKWRRERWRRAAHDLWRYLLVAAILVIAFFLLVAFLTRLVFGADPSPQLRWVSVARGLAAGLVWRRRDSAPALSRSSRVEFSNIAQSRSERNSTRDASGDRDPYRWATLRQARSVLPGA
jgi:hypothetical protein